MGGQTCCGHVPPGRDTGGGLPSLRPGCTVDQASRADSCRGGDRSGDKGGAGSWRGPLPLAHGGWRDAEGLNVVVVVVTDVHSPIRRHRDGTWGEKLSLTTAFAAPLAGVVPGRVE